MMKSILPCLEDGLTGGAQVNVPSQEVFSPEMYQKIKIGKRKSTQAKNSK